MSTAFPTTPAEVPDATFRVLVDAYMAHSARLVDARHGIGEPLPAADLARHAVAAVAVQHAIAERILFTRWVNARDALVYGAGPDDTAAAMGLDLDELVMGLRCWADGQHREGLITAVERDEVLALVSSDVRGCDGCRVVGPLLTAPGTSGRSWRCECGATWAGSTEGTAPTVDNGGVR